MPAEKSGQETFDFEHGHAFGDHIERFNPAFTKVLVRYNPDGPKGNAIQQTRLKRLSDWLHARGRLFLFELLVPATSEQRNAMDGDIDRYDRELRPGLMIRTIAELQGAGVEPDIWKVEGLDAREDCVRLSEQARTGGRDRVACVVLGRGASDARLAHWLQVAATVQGFRGFAVGRTIWQEALEAFRDGAIGREQASRHIADRYSNTIATFSAARRDSPGSA
jgi:5-dehydro-2-deoxygluconokinase